MGGDCKLIEVAAELWTLVERWFGWVEGRGAATTLLPSALKPWPAFLCSRLVDCKVPEIACNDCT